MVVAGGKSRKEPVFKSPGGGPGEPRVLTRGCGSVVSLILALASGSLNLHGDALRINRPLFIFPFMPPTLSPLSAPAMAVAAMLVSLTFSVVFLSAHRRHAEVAGPGWWSVAGVMALFSFAGLLFRFSQNGESTIGLANSLLMTAMFLCWLGVRAYLGMTVRLSWVWAFGGTVILVNAWLFAGDAPPAWRPLFFLLVAGVLALAVLLDLLRRGVRAQDVGVRSLTALTLVELLALLGIGTEVAGAVGAGHFSMQHAEVGLIMTSLFVSALIRLVVYLILVFLRLQQINALNEDQLRRRGAQSWEMLEGLPVGVLALNERAEVLRANGKACELVDMRPREGRSDQHLTLLSSDWCDEAGTPLPPDETPHARAWLARGAQISGVTIGVPSPDRSHRRWLLCNAFLTRGLHMQDRQVVLTLVDTTELRSSQERERQLQAQHLQAQKMEALGSLASGVAHDFNNVLTAIQGHVRLLREETALTNDVDQSLGQIERAARKGRDLVKRILAFGRRQGVSREPLDMGELLDDIGSLLLVLRGPSVHLAWTCDPHMPPIVGDATQLSQVLLNLGTNAIQAIGQGPGTVTIKAVALPIESLIAEGPAGFDVSRHQGPLSPWWVRVVVEDDGCGMDTATQLRIFEPFFTTKPKGEGTGLGLASVKDMVAAHGGFIDLRSRPGQGTRFSLWLPASDAGQSVLGLPVSEH